MGRDFSANGDLDGEGAMPISRYLDAIRRQLWIVILVALIGTSAGVYLSSRMVPEYTAVAKMMVNAPITAQAGAEPPPLRAISWDQIIKSFQVVDPVVRALSLNLSYRNRADSSLFASFAPPDSTLLRPGRYRLTVDSTGSAYTLTAIAGNRIVEQGVPGDSIGRGLGFLWAPPASLLTPRRDVQFAVTTIHQAAASLIGRVTTSLPDQSQFLTISLRDTDPVRATNAVNAWVDQVYRTAFELKKAKLLDSRDRVGGQLAGAERQLRADEAALQKFGEENLLGADNDGAAVAGTGYVQQLNELDATRVTRRDLEAILAAAATNGGAVDADKLYLVRGLLSTYPQLNKQVELLTSIESDIAAKTRYTTVDNPDVKPLVEQAKNLKTVVIPSLARELLATLRKKENDDSARVAALTQQLRSTPKKLIDRQRLQNRVTMSQAVYAGIQGRYDALRLNDIETAPDLTVFQTALVPTVPSSGDKAPRLLLMAVIASIAGGLALVLLIDRLDKRFRYPEQATFELGLPIVGTVPSLRFNRRGGLSPTETSGIIESFRTLRLAVKQHFSAGQPVLLCVSSAGPTEGKSLVSSNLAIAFANAGHKTLLIDGDVRRGVVHTTFEVERRPGLVDYLAGVTDLPSVIHQTATTNLSVMASGSRSRKAPELLVSNHMSALIDEVRGQFDVVIVDSPPFVAGMDAYALGSAVGAMIVVLRKGLTDRKLASAKLEIMDRLPVTILGAVVNGITSDSSYRYYSYDSNYSIDKELNEEALLPDPATAAAAPRLGPPKP